MQLLKVATFVSNKVKPKRCNCGESVAFNVSGVVSYIRDSGIDKIITDATIRNFVTSKQVGCVGKSTKFWGRTASATSAHISRRFLAADVLTEIDKAFASLTPAATSDLSGDSTSSDQSNKPTHVVNPSSDQATLNPSSDQGPGNKATVNPSSDQGNKSTLNPSSDQGNKATVNPCSDQGNKASVDPSNDQEKVPATRSKTKRKRAEGNLEQKKKKKHE